jgi:pentatricopeptide repeat protein
VRASISLVGLLGLLVATPMSSALLPACLATSEKTLAQLSRLSTAPLNSTRVSLWVWEWSGWLRLWAGQPDVAIDHFGTSMRLNPLHRRAGPYLGIGMGHFFTLRFEDAAATLLLSLQEIPSWVPTYRFLASCYAHMGRLEEAHDMVRQLRAITTVDCVVEIGGPGTIAMSLKALAVGGHP